MTLTKADLVLTHEEIETAVNPPGDRLQSMLMWEAADAISQAAAAKAVYAVLDELHRLADLTLTGTTGRTAAVRLEDKVKEQLEAAGLPRPGKSG